MQHVATSKALYSANSYSYLITVVCISLEEIRSERERERERGNALSYVTALWGCALNSLSECKTAYIHEMRKNLGFFRQNEEKGLKVEKNTIERFSILRAILHAKR